MNKTLSIVIIIGLLVILLATAARGNKKDLGQQAIAFLVLVLLLLHQCTRG